MEYKLLAPLIYDLRKSFSDEFMHLDPSFHLILYIIIPFSIKNQSKSW